MQRLNYIGHWVVAGNNGFEVVVPTTYVKNWLHKKF